MTGKSQNPQDLLRHVAALASDEDSSERVVPVFLPRPSHGLALRQETVVVAGTRGAGKTALFRAVQELGSRVRGFFQDDMIPEGKWVEAYSAAVPHPQPEVLDSLVDRVGAARNTALRAFWAVHLLVRLREAGVQGAQVPDIVEDARRQAPGNPAGWIDVAEREIGPVMVALDQVEATLAARHELAFASYDHLDRLGALAGDQPTRARLVSSLLALWLSCSTRYRQLRGKIYLRPDLFDEAEKSFPDASKLRPRSVSLDWDVASLYRLAVRHLANRGPHIESMRAWLLDQGIELKQHPAGRDMGLMPGDMGPDQQRRLATAFAGETMGRGPKKGYTYRWIPARLKDAEGRIAPRSLLRLLRHAATATLSAEPSPGPSLMDPIRLVGALQLTSRDRVAELIEEYPFVRRVENLRGLTMLQERTDIISKLAARPAVDDGFGNDGERVFDELKRIGVVEVRSDGRIDVPDIYRYGYGIKRKGGARAPR